MSIYDTQEQDINRQRAIAQALIQSGNFSPDQVTQEAGHRVVPISPWQTFAKLLTSGIGGYAGVKAGQNQDALDKTKKQDQTDWFNNLGAASQPDPLQAITPSVNYQQPVQASGTTPQDQTDIQRQLSEQGRNTQTFNEADAAVKGGERQKLMSQYLRGIEIGGVPAGISQQGMERFASSMTPKQYDPVKLGPDDILLNPNTGKTMGVGLPKAVKPPAEPTGHTEIVGPDGQPKLITDSELNARLAKGENLKGYHKATLADEMAASATPDAVGMAAARYNRDGSMPAGSARSPMLVQKILNKAAEMQEAIGNSAEAAAARQQAGKAGQAALNQITKQKVMVGAFEKNANMSLDLATQAASKVGRTGIPILNEWLQKGQRNFTNNPELKRFDDSLQTFTSEYGKIMSGSMGNTALSDSMKKHADEMLKAADTPEAFAAASDLLRTEMHNRMTGFDQQINELTQSMNPNGVSATVHGVEVAAQPTTPSASAPLRPGQSTMINGFKVTAH